MTLTELILDGKLRAEVENLLSQMVNDAVEAKSASHKEELDAAEQKRLADVAAKEAEKQIEVNTERAAKLEALKPELLKEREALEKQKRTIEQRLTELPTAAAEIKSK